MQICINLYLHLIIITMAHARPDITYTVYNFYWFYDLTLLLFKAQGKMLCKMNYYMNYRHVVL